MSSSRARSIVRTAVALAASAAALAVPAAAHAGVVPAAASMENGSFSEFSQWNENNGSLTVDRSKAYDGATSAKAHFDGGAQNGYERGIWDVKWGAGDDVWFSAAYYLPVGFKRAMQGEVDLMRTDN